MAEIKAILAETDNVVKRTKIIQMLKPIPMFADLTTSRPYHLKHHKHVLTQKDPDLVLTGHYPIPRASLKRKLMRDISGKSGIAQRTYQLKDSITRTFGTKIDSHET